MPSEICLPGIVYLSQPHTCKDLKPVKTILLPLIRKLILIWVVLPQNPNKSFTQFFFFMDDYIYSQLFIQLKPNKHVYGSLAKMQYCNSQTAHILLYSLPLIRKPSVSW